MHPFGNSETGVPQPRRHLGICGLAHHRYGRDPKDLIKACRSASRPCLPPPLGHMRQRMRHWADRCLYRWAADPSQIALRPQPPWLDDVPLPLPHCGRDQSRSPHAPQLFAWQTATRFFGLPRPGTYKTW